jgi:hypothetical protein
MSHAMTHCRFLLLALAALALTRPALAEELVADFSGSSNTTTREFDVEGPWLLDWRLDADFDQLVALHVWLVDADTGLAVGRVLRRDNRGNGTKLFEEGGRYRLRISTTLARWRMRIKQLTPEEAERYTPKQPPSAVPRINQGD